ncbi:prespore-specific transcription regulator RsfA [Lentibacillus halophilus]|uniref:Prespore-specific transcription regulator RsfA n=1 Tax=Lentibacillus halophilus TaxID=295065 RepID=A0ABP3J5I4_9BACI
MAKIRQDAWSHEDDLLLAETVLRHIREGSTQLNAFEEVGDKLNRTSAACGFRWNAEVRNTYTDAIELAKRQRKEKKRANAVNAKQPIVNMPQMTPDENPVEKESTPETVEQMPEMPEMPEKEKTTANTEPVANTDKASTLTMDDVIRFLKQVETDYHASNQSKASVEQLEGENQTLKQDVGYLKEQLSKTEQQLESLREDYHVFMQIMDRARKMTVFEDQHSLQAPSFRMDKNGNLQQVSDGSSHQ